MKYKVGDRVKVRSDLTLSELYDGYWAFDEMIKKNIATITFVHDDHYEIKEDDFYWTDKMFEGLAEEDKTAFIQKNGKPIAVVMSYERYQRMFEQGLDINDF